MKYAVLAGASGLVGSLVLNQLIAQKGYDKIFILVRRIIENLPSDVIQIQVDFEHLEEIAFTNGFADFYCMLGTTLKKAGSANRFYEIEYNSVLNFAKLAKKHSANCFGIISAMGANSSSRLLYNRTKGEIENSLIDLKLNKTVILRPSLIIGERKEKRIAEKMAIKMAPILDFLLVGSFKKYRSNRAVKIADAMVQSVVKLAPQKVRIIESLEINRF